MVLRPTSRSKQDARLITGFRESLIAFIVQFLLSSTLLHPVAAETVQLVRQDGGGYLVPVQINNTLVLSFLLDTGADSAVIPLDVFQTLKRTGTVKPSDFIGTAIAVLADGSERPQRLFVIREMRVGDHVVRNVTASVAPPKGVPLLGQSFFCKLRSWTIDNAEHALILNDRPSSTGAARQQAALPAPSDDAAGTGGSGCA
jgi:clan AA aspartic protease (TIGR02281 family)